MTEHLLLPSGGSIAVLIVGVILLLLAALADTFGLFGGTAGVATRGALRVALALVGAALIAWAALCFSAARSAAAPKSVTPPAPAAPPDLVQAATTAIAACPGAAEPSVPDGNRASLEQMVAAGKAFRQYDAGIVAYTHCIDDNIDRLTQQYGAVVGEAEVQRLKQFGLTAHNTAIDQEQGLADKFNAQVHIYKSHHPQ